MTDHNCSDFCKHKAQEKVMERQAGMELDDGLPKMCCGNCRHYRLTGTDPWEHGYCSDLDETVNHSDSCLAWEAETF